MEWVVLIILTLIAAIIWGVITGLKDSKENTAKLATYNADISKERNALITISNNASLPVLDAAKHGYRTVGNEKLIAIQSNVSRIELKGTGRYRVGGASVSIPIAKGIRYRVGAGSIKSEKMRQVTASGRLMITDRAFIFESSEKNERITWGQVADIELMSNGFLVSKRNGPSREFMVENPDPKFAAIVDLMLNRIG